MTNLEERDSALEDLMVLSTALMTMMKKNLLKKSLKLLQLNSGSRDPESHAPRTPVDGFHAPMTTMLMVISMSDATRIIKEELFAKTPQIT